MHTIKGNECNRRLCKGMAFLLMVALLVNQISVPVYAEEIESAVCCCDVRCSADQVNTACPICMAQYEQCEAAENLGDTSADEEAGDAATDEDTPSNTDAVDTPVGDAEDDPEVSETDEDVHADADPEADVTMEEVSLADEEVESILPEAADDLAAEDNTFQDGAYWYTILSEEGKDQQVALAKPAEGTAVAGDLVIPATASDGTNTYAVTRIGGSAFRDCSSLTSITIPDSVDTIWGSAFYNCTGLTSITIPDSVTMIYGSAFYNCNSLTSIHIPNGITTIRRATFQYCRSLKSIVIPDGVTNIGQMAFGLCDDLESVVIPESVTVIENSAFSLCKSLRSVTIPSNVSSIGNASFGYSYNLESVTILNDHISMGDGSFIQTKLNEFKIAVSENITATPTVGNLCFRDVPLGEDTYLTFLTKDGTRELSHTTTPTLAEAVEAYDTVDDGGINDGYWYGWRLPEVPEVTGYPVTIHVNRDDATWEDCAKEFALSPDNGGTYITDLTDVANGTYTIYEITDTGYVNTGISVTVADAAAEATVDYYTVTFYHEGAVFDERIVLSHAKVSAPSAIPTKDGYTFYRWVTSEGGATEFDFENPITAKTDIYASWIENEKETYTIVASAGDGGSVSPSGEVKVESGGDQQFTITPMQGYRISSVLVDGGEVLGREQTAVTVKAGLIDGENGAKYYVFENVTSNHTLAAYFEAVGSDDNPPDDDDDPPDDSGGGGGNPDDGGGDGGNPDDSGEGDGSPDGSGDNNSVDYVEVSPSIPISDTNVILKADSVSHSNDRIPVSGSHEPKTGDASCTEIYATIAMAAGLAYLLLYFMDGKNGMTEEEKKEIIASLVKWAKRGRRIRKYAALAAIFLILVYYHSVGKRIAADWKTVYEK